MLNKKTTILELFREKQLCFFFNEWFSPRQQQAEQWEAEQWEAEQWKNEISKEKFSMISGVLLSLFDSLENYGRRLKPGSEYAQKLADSLEKDLNYLIRTNELAQYLQDGSKETSDPNLAFIINQIFDLKQKIQTLRTGEIINETPQMPSGAKNMGFQIEDNNTITFSKNYNPILPSSNKTTINFLPEEWTITSLNWNESTKTLSVGTSKQLLFNLQITEEWTIKID